MRVFLIFFLFPLFIKADTTDSAFKTKHVAGVVKTDTSVLNIRSFNPGSLDTYKKEKAFDYSANDEPARSLWERFWRWFWGLFEDISSKAIPNSIWKYLFLTLGLAGLIYIVLKVSGMDVIQMLTGKAQTVEIPYKESLENIHEISFDEEIEKSVSTKNYRLAVRMLYLKTLKKLNDSGFIQWQLDKTNAAYITELIHPDKQQQFKNLTQQFEYVWYGDFPVDGIAYEHINNSFLDFNQKLS